MTSPDIHGIIAYPVTPFTADDELDVKALGALVDRLVADGTHGIVPLGSTGESAYLNESEFDAVIDTTLSVVDGRVPVICGASDLTTANTIRRAQYAERAGADAVMVVPISYWKLSEREIKQHYAAIGAAIGIPIMVYNNPATSGIDMRPELLVEMFNEIDNVTMVKESSGDITRMERMSELTDGRLPFYNGSNPMVLKAFKAGAKGWCTAAPNLLPQPCLDLYAAARSGDWTKAEAIYNELKPFLEFIVSGGLPTTIKGGLDLLGLGVGVPRLPLLPLDEGGRDELRQLLAV